MNIKKIITHNGRAHMDDLLAACFLAYKTNAPIVRKDWPTEEELNDPEICIVDFGKQHDKGLLNFDHHQITGGNVCAFTLVLEHFNMRDNKALPWIQYVETYDHCGPKAAMELLGSSQQEQIKLLANPIYEVMLDEFSQVKEIYRYQDFYHTLSLIGKHISDEYWSYYAYTNIVKENCSILNVNGYKIMDMMKLNRAAMNSQASKDIYTDLGASMILSKNDRGEGQYRLTRIDGKINFNLAKDVVDTKFVHQNGFLFTFDCANLKVALELITRSLTDDQLNLSFE